MSGTSGIKDTASGLRYFTGSVTPPGKTDLEPHLKDIAMLRAFYGAGVHSSVAKIWYGNFSESQKPRAPRKLPWAHYLASKFRAAGTFVPKPCAIVYPNQDLSVIPYLDFAAYGNESPDPSVAAERVLQWDSSFDSLSAKGLPPFAQQDPVYALTRALNGATYSGAQPDIREKFGSATEGADKVLASVFGSPAWPAPQAVLDALGATPASLAFPITNKRTQFPAFFAFAHQALAKTFRT